MTREEFKMIVKGLKAIYTDPKFIYDSFAFDMWYMALADIPYEEVSLATQYYIQTSKCQPMPADIRDCVMRNRASKTDEISELEAWNMVYKASTNGLYGSQEEFDKLPEVIRLTLGNHISLKEMANMQEETLLSVEKSHFVRSYRATLEKLRTKKQLTQKVNQGIETINEKYNPTLSIVDKVVDRVIDKSSSGKNTWNDTSNTRDGNIPSSVEEELSKFYQQHG